MSLACYIAHEPCDLAFAGWRHQIKTFAALMAFLYEGNSLVTGEFTNKGQ